MRKTSINTQLDTEHVLIGLADNMVFKVATNAHAHKPISIQTPTVVTDHGLTFAYYWPRLPQFKTHTKFIIGILRLTLYVGKT